MGAEPVSLQPPIRWSSRPAVVPLVTDPELVLPVGTVTLLLSDAAGGAGAVHAAVRELAGRHGGVTPFDDGEGGEAVAAFARASDALGCAIAVVSAHLDARAVMHTGELDVAAEGAYLGPAVARARGLLGIARPGQLLVSRPTHDLVVDVLPDAVRLLDLGDHQPAVGRREHLWQVLHPALPRTSAAFGAGAVGPSDLPVPLTPLIGRVQETEDVAAALAANRLVTLTGIGGTGKTRLALHVAGIVRHDHPDGCWFVELAAIEAPGDVVDRTLATLRVPDAPGMEPLDALLSFLADRKALVVLDNCEHVIEEVASLAARIVGRCSQVTILATSRESLGIGGEVVFRVPSLPTPPPATGVLGVDRYEAVALFCARAAQATGAFHLDEECAEHVGEICRRLDGIPLAIELAAARVNVLSPRQIADGLHDQFRLLAGGSRVALPRQQTIEASVDWSYALLSDAERCALRRLAVMPSDFGLPAAEHVCALEGVEREDVLDLLAQLVDKSLVVAITDGAEGRYRLLETIRQYAARRLVAAGETEAVRERLLAFAEDVVASWRDRLVGEAQLLARDALEREVPAIVAALTWSIDTDLLDRAAALVLDVFPLWDQIGLPPELRRAYGHLLDQPLPGAQRGAVAAAAAMAAIPDPDAATLAAIALESPTPPAWRAIALVVAAACDVFESRPALPTFDAAVRAASESGATWLQAMATTMRALARFDDVRGAVADTAAALSLAEEAGHEYEARRARAQLADLHRRAGRLAEARALLETLMVAAQPRRETLADAQIANALGYTLIDLGEIDAARSVLHASRERWRGIGYGEHKAIEGLAYAAIAEDDPSRAIAAVEEFATSHPSSVMRAGAGIELVHALLAMRDAPRARAAVDGIVSDSGALANTAIFRVELAPHLARVALLEGDLDRAERHAHEELETAAEHDLPRLHILGLEHLAEILGAGGATVDAVRLASAAAAGRERSGFVALPYERRSQDALLAAARNELGSDGFERARTEGASLTLEAATDYARRGRGTRLRPKIGWASLTPAEVRVADLVAEGLTNPQIGERLFISAKTVRTHLSNIFAKLDISSRAQLAGEVTKRRLS